MNDKTRTLVVWYSTRHMPCPSQVQELDVLFPGCRIVTCNQMFSGVDDLIDHFESVGGDEMVVILPFNLIHRLVDRGYRPIRSIMRTVQEGERFDVFENRHRGSTTYLQFMGFERITDVKVRAVRLSA